MWRLMRSLSSGKRIGKDRGQVLAIVAVSLTAILAMAALVLDGALLYENRRQLQNAADGAALAGARFLLMDENKAKTVAYDYANRNGVPASQVLAVEVGKEPKYGYPIITVKTTRTVSLFFARAIGKPTAPVGAIATAIVTPMAPQDIWPWGTTYPMIEAAKEEGKPVVLKVGAHEEQTGNFKALQLGQPGANQYENNIKNGYQGVVPVNVPPGTWTVPSETGNIVGPTEKGTSFVLTQSQSGSYADYCNPAFFAEWGPQLGCPNVGLVPIVKGNTWEDINGKKDVDIIDFGVFYLQKYETKFWSEEDKGKGKNGWAEVTGTFYDYAFVSAGKRKLGGDLTGLVGISLWPSGPNLP